MNVVKYELAFLFTSRNPKRPL